MEREKQSLRSNYEKSNELLHHLTEAHKQACAKLVQFDKILSATKEENAALKEELVLHRSKESEHLLEREEILKVYSV